MIRIFVPAAPTREGVVYELQQSISEWMRANDVEHWSCYRQNYSYLAVEFFGLNYEEDALAFKIAFGGV